MPEPYTILRDFIQNKMRMSHIYQPVMLEVLLANDGRASTRQIAAAFLIQDQSQLEYYEQIVKLMPGKVLQSHGIVEREGADYKLAARLTGLAEKEREDLIALCRVSVETFKPKRGEAIWEHRRPGLGIIPGRVRYETLKRATFRCELCGISADERALDVDHITPRSVGGSEP